MARMELNDKSVRSLVPPPRGNRIDYDIPKGGRDAEFVRGFAVRTTAAGRRTFLLVYVSAEGRERRHRIGDYPTHTVTTARAEAARLRRSVDSGGDPFAERKVVREHAERQRERDAATFGKLLDSYVQALHRAKKPSAKKVERELHRTVKDEFPALWKAPAERVTLDDLVKITNRLVRANKYRQAEKTRSYLRAAYNAAASARGNAAIADLFEPFAQLANIGRDVATVSRPTEVATAETTNSKQKRALSAQQLSHYWRRISAMPTRHGALLRLHLLTGAQRCEQLGRLSKQFVDRDGMTMTLIDIKGRRKQPRKHLVPLLPEALDALDAMAGEGSHSFSVDEGKHAAVYHTVRQLVAVVAADMQKAHEIDFAFTPGELRITIETRLAAAGVAREVRAQLQSHGLSGVQQTHYDKHHYLDEKRAALETLRDMIEPNGKVVPLRKKRA